MRAQHSKKPACREALRRCSTTVCINSHADPFNRALRSFIFKLPLEVLSHWSMNSLLTWLALLCFIQMPLQSNRNNKSIVCVAYLWAMFSGYSLNMCCMPRPIYAMLCVCLPDSSSAHGSLGITWQVGVGRSGTLSHAIWFILSDHNCGFPTWITK